MVSPWNQHCANCIGTISFLIVIEMTVSVCLSAIISPELVTTRPIFAKILCMLPMAVARSGSVAIRFVHSISRMTSYLHISNGCFTSCPAEAQPMCSLWLGYERHHHGRVAGEGRRVVAPPCPRSTARLQRSPIGRVKSFHSWSSHLFRGRPNRLCHMRSGGRLNDTKSHVCRCLSSSQATCPNTEMRRRDSEVRPIRYSTSIN